MAVVGLLSPLLGLSMAANGPEDPDGEVSVDEATIGRWVTATLDAGAPYPRSHLTWALRHLVDACQAAGDPLDPETVLDLSTIERHITRATRSGVSDASRGNQRSMIHWVRRAVLGPSSNMRGSSLRAADPQRPLTPSELHTYMNFARLHPLESVRHNLVALLAMTVGCGLATEDLRRVRGRDIARRDDGSVVVRVTGRRQRTVTCRRDWEDDLALVSSAAGDRYVFRAERDDNSRAKNLVSGWVERVTWPPEVGPFRATQGRASWVVAHLDAGTPARVLVGAAGVSGLDALDRLVRFTAPVDETVAADFLRGV